MLRWLKHDIYMSHRRSDDFHFISIRTAAVQRPFTPVLITALVTSTNIIKKTSDIKLLVNNDNTLHQQPIPLSYLQLL